jgi:hypothetical protein
MLRVKGGGVAACSPPYHATFKICLCYAPRETLSWILHALHRLQTFDILTLSRKPTVFPKPQNRERVICHVRANDWLQAIRLRCVFPSPIIIHLIDSTTRFVIWFGFEAKRNIPKVVKAKRTDYRCAFRITEQ